MKWWSTMYICIPFSVLFSCSAEKCWTVVHKIQLLNVNRALCEINRRKRNGEMFGTWQMGSLTTPNLLHGSNNDLSSLITLPLGVRSGVVLHWIIAVYLHKAGYSVLKTMFIKTRTSLICLCWISVMEKGGGQVRGGSVWTHCTLSGQLVSCPSDPRLFSQARTHTVSIS